MTSIVMTGTAVTGARAGRSGPAQRVGAVPGTGRPYGMNRAKHSSANQFSRRVRVITVACAAPVYAKPRTALMSRHRLNVACRVTGAFADAHGAQASVRAGQRLVHRGHRAVEADQPPGTDRRPGQHGHWLAGGHLLRGHPVEGVAAAPLAMRRPRSRAGTTRFPGPRIAIRLRWATGPGNGPGPRRPATRRTSPSGAGRRSGSSRCPARCRASARTAARRSGPVPAGRKPSG